MSEPADFIDAALQDEASWSNPHEEAERDAPGLRFYGASIGAIRGTIRNAQRRYPSLAHDELTALASELWAEPVYERRLAAIVLLQERVGLLVASDLTRLEGFVRTAESGVLVEALARDVIAPLIEGLDDTSRARAAAVLDRWESESDEQLRRAASLAG